MTRSRTSDIRLLSWIDDYLFKHQYAPSLREAMKFCGVTSTSTMQARFDRLRDAGLLGYLHRQPRTVHCTFEGLDLLYGAENGRERRNRRLT